MASGNSRFAYSVLTFTPPSLPTHMGEVQFVWFQAPHNLLSFVDDCFVCPGNTLELLLFYTWAWVRQGVVVSYIWFII